MEITDWIQSIVLLVTVVGLIISILNNRKQVKIFNEQLKLSFFADYTKRYQEIILNLPEDINKCDFDFNQLPIDVKNKTLRYIRVYFDLCSEEYDLWKAGYIDNRIWNNWKEGIEFTFSKTAFRSAWNLINLDTIYYPEFNKWLNEIFKKTEIPKI